MLSGFVIFTKTGWVTQYFKKKSQNKMTNKIERPSCSIDLNHKPSLVANQLNKSKFQDESDWTCNQRACNQWACSQT